MKKGEIITGIVERIEFPNKGILEIDGETITVKHALPGQEIRFMLNKRRNGKNEGRLLEVLTPSPLETEPNRCPHFGVCGGCLMQSIPYAEQLRIKEAQVKALLEKVCPGHPWEGIRPSPAWEGYRNKMEFSFGDEEKGGPLALGMHRRGSFHDVVNVDHCRIVHPDFTRILTAAREFFQKQNVPFYKKLKQEGYLRHLLIRRAVKTGEILAALVTTGQTWLLSPESPDLQKGEGDARGLESVERRLLSSWKELLTGLRLEGSFAGILHIRNDSLADVVQSDGIDILYGRDYFYEELLGLRFRISPFSFFQTNSLGAEVLYDTVRQYLGDAGGKVIFDLYSGTGTIAQILAPVAKKVVGVEIVEEAVRAARQNAAGNRLSNCEFIAGDVRKVIEDLEDRPDLIILDPPREGIHPKALDFILRFGVERIVYISCKPTSLARDLEAFLAYGYEVERVCCVDMFASTANIETICSLSRIK